jgi:hypothetical protein
MKKNAIDHQNNEKTERKKNLSVSAKKTFMFVSHPQFIKKNCVNYENTESHGFMSMLSVIVRILCSPSQSCFLKKSNENFPHHHSSPLKNPRKNIL